MTYSYITHTDSQVGALARRSTSPVLCHVTYDAVGPPPSPPGNGHVTRPRDDVRGHVITRTEFSLSYVSPHPQTPRSACVWGGGVSVDPAVCYGPGAISMKEDWVQGVTLHSHTQISYAGTRDNSRRRSYMPSTIVVACGLLSPMPWFSAAFYPRGGKG